MPQVLLPQRLDEGFDRQAELSPDAVALHDHGRRVTFAELQGMSNRIAAGLRNSGVPAGTIIGVHLRRSVEYVASLLGIFKAGYTAMPLPPSFPAARIRDMLAVSQVGAAIDAAATPLSVGETPVLRVAQLLHGPDLRTSAYGPPEAVAFVLASSGSTGRPKLIARSHRSFFHRLHWTWERHPYQPGETCCQKSFKTTTHSIYELFEPLLGGTPTHIIGDDEVRNLDRFWEGLKAGGISRLLLVPSLLEASLHLPGFKPPDLRVLVLMGESVSRQLAQRAIEAFRPTTSIYSIYGSTESSSSLVMEITQESLAGPELPLGRPLCEAIRVRVMDGELRPVRSGSAGMLYLGGPQLFDGYLEAPELTSSAFLADPETHERLFRTNDLVRLAGDGTIYFVGRTDHTVKIRGFRVDLPEVERAILSLPSVTQAVVIPRNPGSDQSFLVAYVTPAAASAGDILKQLHDALPPYMVPARVVALDRFPTMPGGKVDRQALSAAKLDPVSPLSRTLSPTEARVLRIWRDLLGNPDIDRDSEFFESGGTSLSVFALVARLRSEFDLPATALSDRSIYRYSTVAAQAAELDGLRFPPLAESSPTEEMRVVLKRAAVGASARPIFVFSSAGGTLGAYEKLVKALRTDREIVGLRDPYLWGARDPLSGFDGWVGVFLDAIRAHQPRGPYTLIAYSSAGAFGYEAARRLRLAGEAVDRLILIDPIALDRSTRERFGYWALDARFRRRPVRMLVRAVGHLRGLLPHKTMVQTGPVTGLTVSKEQHLALSQDARRALGHLRAFSVLLELNTGLPFALTEADLRVEDGGASLRVLEDRVSSLAPGIGPEILGNMLVQYVMQVQAQHACRLGPYDSPVWLYEPASPAVGLIKAQLRPVARHLTPVVLPLGNLSPRTEELAAAFPARMRPHYLCMRNDTFVEALATHLGGVLQE